MLRRACLIGCLLGGAACTTAREPGLAWPKLHEVDPDARDGESLAPRPKTQTAAAVASSDDRTPAPAETAVTPLAATPAAASPAATTITAPTEEIMTEDMVIEVDE